MQLKQDRRVFDTITFLISLLFPFLLSFVMSFFLNESFSEVLKVSIWTALPFAFLFRTIVKLSHKKIYRKMPWSHFTSTGFYLNQLDLLKIINLAVYKGEKIAVPKYEGNYYKLSYPEGTEFWVSINSNSKLASVTPFFRGKSQNKVTITDMVENPHSIYNGTFYAWTGINNHGPENENSLPFVFDNPDFLVHSDSNFPQTADITLTAFPSNITVFDDIRDFYKIQPEKANTCVKSFTPGETTTNSSKTESALPKSHATFSGIVRNACLLENTETLMKFYWLSVETLSLIIDVVVDRRMLKSIPRKGNIVNITGLLTGDWVSH